MLTRRQIWRRCPSRDKSIDLSYRGMLPSPLMRAFSLNTILAPLGQFNGETDSTDEHADTLKINIDDNTDSQDSVDIDDLYVSACDTSSSPTPSSHSRNNHRSEYFEENSNNTNGNRWHEFQKQRNSNSLYISNDPCSGSNDSLYSSSNSSYRSTSFCVSEENNDKKIKSPTKVRFSETVSVVRIATRRQLRAYLPELYWTVEDCDNLKREAFLELSTYSNEHKCTLQQAVIALYQNSEQKLYTLANRCSQLDFCLDQYSNENSSHLEEEHESTLSASTLKQSQQNSTLTCGSTNINSKSNFNFNNNNLTCIDPLINTLSPHIIRSSQINDLNPSTSDDNLNTTIFSPQPSVKLTEPMSTPVPLTPPKNISQAHTRAISPTSLNDSVKITQSRSSPYSTSPDEIIKSTNLTVQTSPENQDDVVPVHKCGLIAARNSIADIQGMMVKFSLDSPTTPNSLESSLNLLDDDDNDNKAENNL